MSIQSTEVGEQTQYDFDQNMDAWGLETEVPDHEVIADSEGDYEVSIEYGGETIARVLGNERANEEMQEAGLVATGLSWLEGETIEEPFPGQIREDRDYGLQAQAGNLMLYDSEDNVEQVGNTEADNGFIAYMWEERDEDTHFEERGELHILPGDETDINYNGMGLDL
jgi:hypothetical protein